MHGPAAAVDAAIASMQDRVKFVGRDDWTGMNEGRHAIVIIRTRSGRTFEEEVWHQPMERADLEEKFQGLVEPRFGPAKAASVKRLLDDLPTAESVRPLMKALRA